MALSSPAPPTSRSSRGRATDLGEVVPLPLGPLPRLLLGLCRPGDPLEPVERRDGWALYRWRGEDGTSAEVALRSAEHSRFRDGDRRAAEALRRARSHPKAHGEFQAVLVRLAERDGQEGQWRWGDVAQVVYGPAAKSHHNELMRLWVALLEEGHWRFGAQPPAPQSEHGSPWGGAPLVTTESHEPSGGCRASEARACRCSLTVWLAKTFAAALAHRRQLVPVDILQLPQADHSNPEGRRPSRATLLRVRSTALQDWHAADASSGDAATVQTTTLQELLGRAGVDVNAHIARRHLGDLFSDVVATLRATAARVGVGLSQVPVRARRLLATVLELEGPGPRRAANGGALRGARRSTAVPTPSGGGATARPGPPRGPP